MLFCVTESRARKEEIDRLVTALEGLTMTRDHQRLPSGTAACPLIFEKGAPGRRGYRLPELDVPEVPVGELIPQAHLRRRRRRRCPR